MVNPKMENVVIAENEDFQLSVIEPKPGYYLLHCDVYSAWTKELYRQMLKWWSEILEEFYIDGQDFLYVLLPVEERKIAKFAIKFGFEPFTAHDYVTDDGDTGTLMLYRFPVKETIENRGE